MVFVRHKNFRNPLCDFCHRGITRVARDASMNNFVRGTICSLYNGMETYRIFWRLQVFK